LNTPIVIIKIADAGTLKFEKYVYLQWNIELHQLIYYEKKFYYIKKKFPAINN